MQIACPIEAILVKVAAAGLLTKHIGSTIESMRPHLKELRLLYGCNVCGEGGEYETLTLDCPLFKYGRIVIDSWKVITVSPDSIAPVALLHPEAFHVEPKNLDSTDGPSRMIISVPPGFNKSGSESKCLGLGSKLDSAAYINAEQPPTSTTRLQTVVHVTRQTLSCLEEYVTISCTARVDTECSVETDEGAQVTASMLREALMEIESEMKRLQLQWDDSLFVHLYLPSMKHFSEANAAYLDIVPPVNPPARACVQVDGQPGAPSLLTVEVLYRLYCDSEIRDESANAVSQRKVLHVQSISEWAPSCIGPYSQAVMHDKFVYLAGQIPLVPETMQVLRCSETNNQATLIAQLQLVVRHCTSIVIALQTDFVQSLLWGILYFSRNAYEQKHAMTEALAWLQQCIDGNGCQEESSGNDGNDGNDEEEEGEGKSIILDPYLLPPSGIKPRYWDPLVLWVALPALPRGVDVELQPVVASQARRKKALRAHDPRSEKGSGSESDECDECEQWTAQGRSQLETERVELFDKPHLVDTAISVQMLHYSGDESFFRAHALITISSDALKDTWVEAVVRTVKYLESEARSKVNASGNTTVESTEHALNRCTPNIKMYASLKTLCCKGLDDCRSALPAWLQGLATIIPVVSVGTLDGREGDLAVEYFLSTVP